ncbi:hypothetical protein H6G80_30725 [Nostoc sp. FACHB-87]|uniref:hypothetical protein n=1 Tax=Nostocaceae TaxID=1162 RepID=UPI0016886867|nr:MULTISPECIES: hypothetical protein [Nostocaceae]MBD2458428.1 hypothetical protein [Nostoc sp. FACHB-87]MBD2479475.1 hypothetical protein [Anabaena sp. FACHB-83]
MPRKKLDRKKDYIQIVIEPDDKAAFDAWCLANGITMSEIIRQEIAPYIAKGKKLLSGQS